MNLRNSIPGHGIAISIGRTSSSALLRELRSWEGGYRAMPVL